MKVTSAILAIFFFGIILFPCADEVAGDTYGTEVNFHSGDQDHQADADLCTPFCQCNCCQTLVANGQSYYNEIISFQGKDHQTYYIDDLGKDIPDPFLHPPQI